MFVPITSASDPRVQVNIGKKFNKLTAIKFVEMRRYRGCGMQIWEFQCDCGNTTTTTLNAAKSGTTKSCGCVVRTHGLSKTSIYGIWCTMIQRCTNPRVKRFSDYGGRGIKVCPKWTRFSGFLKDMGAGYRKGLTVERIDNDGPYSPENCRWATRFEQNQNTRSSRRITFNGETLNLTTWARRIGITHSALIRRLKYWKFEDAMSVKPIAWCYEI